MNPLDATSVIAATGLIGIFCVLVAETGLLVGFFLPGDSLLFTAGLLAATHGALHLPLGGVLAVAAAGALIGAQIGYLDRPDARASAARQNGPGPALHRGVDRVTEVIERYGPAKAIVLARFIPVVRTVMNPMAGMIGSRSACSPSGRSRRADLDRRRHHGRVLAGLPDHRHRQVPAADHRRRRGHLADPGGAGAARPGGSGRTARPPARSLPTSTVSAGADEHHLLRRGDRRRRPAGRHRTVPGVQPGTLGDPARR